MSRKVIVAFLLAPLVPAVVLELCKRLSMPENVYGASSVIWFYPATVIFGIPAFLIFEMLGWRRLVHYLMGGFLVGSTIAFLVVLTERKESGFSYGGSVCFALFVGGLVATETSAFWTFVFLVKKRST